MWPKKNLVYIKHVLLQISGNHQDLPGPFTSEWINTEIDNEYKEKVIRGKYIHFGDRSHFKLSSVTQMLNARK